MLAVLVLLSCGCVNYFHQPNRNLLLIAPATTRANHTGKILINHRDSAPLHKSTYDRV